MLTNGYESGADLLDRRVWEQQTMTEATTRRRNRPTAAEVHGAMVAALFRRGRLKDAPDDFIDGLRDALAWAHGEPGTRLGAALEPGPALDPQSDAPGAP